LIETVLPPDERETGLTRHDLSEIPLASALDDARSLSLFATRRVIWLASAEAVLPRGRAAASDDDSPTAGGAAELASYLASPTPDVTIVIDSARFDFEGEEKTRLEAVRKFFAAVPAVVEFRAFAPDAARALAQNLAKQAGLKLGNSRCCLTLRRATPRESPSKSKSCGCTPAPNARSRPTTSPLWCPTPRHPTCSRWWLRSDAATARARSRFSIRCRARASICRWR
jgi:hypothetical protein